MTTDPADINSIDNASDGIDIRDTGDINSCDTTETPLHEETQSIETIDSNAVETPRSIFDVPTQKELSLEAKVEAIIFASPRPIKALEILDLFQGEITQEALQDALDQLYEHYKGRRGGFRIEFIKSLGYQFQTVQEAAPLMERLFASRPRPISKAGLETLAIIAYRQPVTRAEVEYIRGVDAGGMLKNLMDKGLVECVGRKPDAGRPMLFGTTSEFLKIFRVNSLKDLPPLESFQPPPELLKEASQAVEEIAPVDIEQFISCETESRETELENIELTEPEPSEQDLPLNTVSPLDTVNIEETVESDHGTSTPPEMAFADGNCLAEGSRTLD